MPRTRRPARLGRPAEERPNPRHRACPLAADQNDADEGERDQDGHDHGEDEEGLTHDQTPEYTLTRVPHDC